jgi:D-alanyl-D-alanine carboxypeptidase/D-alanyl-D-alanine-endopeptidase (penicillin-binding protein 4)
MRKLLPFLIAISFLISCSPGARLGKIVREDLLRDSSLRAAHVGISIYEPATGKYIYDHQGDKYFVPASNTKIATCYAAMKYLGDSLPGLKVIEYSDSLVLEATGDPTFMHPGFRNQPVYEFLKKLNKPALLGTTAWKANALGSGWSWGDYGSDYMAERSAFPIYGNVATFSGRMNDVRVQPYTFRPMLRPSQLSDTGYVNDAGRKFHSNEFTYRATGKAPAVVNVPFITSDALTYYLLTDTIKNLPLKRLPESAQPPSRSSQLITRSYTIRSQPSDSLLKPMMHRSDNFFAEQSLLMASYELLGIMSDSRIIDTILKTDFRDLPQRPRWADGSGLSRYNLFTPQDFVAILNKIKNEFGMERVKEVFPTGGEGTLSNFYKADSGFFYAKTGTLSGVVALSGYMYTRSNRLFLFSVLVNNHQSSAVQIRRAVERFLRMVMREN